MAYQPELVDTYATGAAAQSALNNNLLNSPAGAAGLDLAPYPAATVVVVGSAGITAGAIAFEGSNDNTTWISLPYFDEALVSSGGWSVSAVAIAASTVRVFSVRLLTRYARVRISTAFAGGTVQAFYRLAANEQTNRATLVAGSLSATATPANPTSGSLVNSTASTNAAVVKSTAANLYNVAISNPTATPCFLKYFNKATAPAPQTDVPVIVIPVPANSFQAHDLGVLGWRFATGLGRALVGGAADLDNTNAPVGVKVLESYT